MRTLVIAVSFLTMALGALVVPALASESGRAGRPQETAFVASGQMCLAELPVVKAAPGPTGITVNATGERLTGVIDTAAGWDDLAGAEVGVTITKELSFFSLLTGTFSGRVAGDITVRPSGRALRGRFHGSVGGVFTDPNDLLGSISMSNARVVWSVQERGRGASGEAVAGFTADPETGEYCGPFSFSGQRDELD